MAGWRHESGAGEVTLGGDGCCESMIGEVLIKVEDGAVAIVCHYDADECAFYVSCEAAGGFFSCGLEKVGADDLVGRYRKMGVRLDPGLVGENEREAILLALAGMAKKAREPVDCLRCGDGYSLAAVAFFDDQHGQCHATSVAYKDIGGMATLEECKAALQALSGFMRDELGYRAPSHFSVVAYKDKADIYGQIGEMIDRRELRGYLGCQVRGRWPVDGMEAYPKALAGIETGEGYAGRG